MRRHLGHAPTLRATLDGVVMALLAASLPMACGGKVDGEGQTPAPTLLPRDDERPDAPPPPPPPPTTVPAGCPSYGHDYGSGAGPSSCGDGGGRLANTWTSSATRQVPCEVSIADIPVCGYRSVPQDDCLRYCIEGGEESDGGAIAKMDKLGGEPYCQVHRLEQDVYVLECGVQLPGGRREGGYDGERASVRDGAVTSLARFFGRLAQLETLSIRAFGTLAGELAHHDAPIELVEAARAARLEETRHARTTWRLAKRFGARPVRLAPSPVVESRSLLELAIDNAREGCVRETFGAVAAAYQARAASDDEIREAFSEIARDEAEHAALAWRIHAFCAARLDAAERRQLDSALRTAFDELRDEIARGDTAGAELQSVAGVPGRETALSALSALERLAA